jgi:hypothetical protein
MPQRSQKAVRLVQGAERCPVLTGTQLQQAQSRLGFRGRPAIITTTALLGAKDVFAAALLQTERGFDGRYLRKGPARPRRSSLLRQRQRFACGPERLQHAPLAQLDSRAGTQAVAQRGHVSYPRQLRDALLERGLRLV